MSLSKIADLLNQKLGTAIVKLHYAKYEEHDHKRVMLCKVSGSDSGECTIVIGRDSHGVVKKLKSGFIMRCNQVVVVPMTPTPMVIVYNVEHLTPDIPTQALAGPSTTGGIEMGQTNIPTQALAGPSTTVIPAMFLKVTPPADRTKNSDTLIPGTRIKSLTREMNYFELHVLLVDVGQMKSNGFFFVAADCSGVVRIQVAGDGAKFLHSTMTTGDCYTVRGSGYVKIKIDSSNERSFVGTTNSITFKRIFNSDLIENIVETAILKL